MEDRNELIVRWLTVLYFSGWAGLFVAIFYKANLYIALWMLGHLIVLIGITIIFVLYLLWEYAIAPTLEYLMER